MTILLTYSLHNSSYDNRFSSCTPCADGGCKGHPVRVRRVELSAAIRRSLHPRHHDVGLE